MTTLHIIRHGETDWNLERRIQGQTDSYLSELGKKQAQEIGSALKTIPFSAAYASSSIRARDTAEFILAHHKIPLTLRDEMREIHLGAWEGRLYQDVEKADKENMRRFRKQPADFNMPGAETFLQVQQRATKLLEELLPQHPDQHVLLVSHGIWIKSILSHFENRDIRDFWSPPHIANCCHSIIEFNNNEPRIVRYAELCDW